jgi:putative ABC transport system substrate-binding protein
VSALVAKNTAPYQRALAAFKMAYDGPVSVHVLDFEGDQAIVRIRAEKPSLLLAVGIKAAKVAQELMELPIVYCMVMDPRRQGLDGPRLVGVPLDIPAQVQLGELKRLLPSARTIGVVYNPQRSAAQVEEAQAAAQKLSLQLLAEPAGSAQEFPAAMARLLPKVQALWVLADSTIVTQNSFRAMLESAYERKLPLVTFSDEFVAQGALAAVAPDFEGSGREAARLALEIARGKKPAELSVAEPKWNLIVNLSTARSLGVEVPSEVLKSAVAVQ